MDNAENFCKLSLSQILPAIGCIEFSEFSKHMITATLPISSSGDPLSALNPALCQKASFNIKSECTITEPGFIPCSY